MKIKQGWLYIIGRLQNSRHFYDYYSSLRNLDEMVNRSVEVIGTIAIYMPSLLTLMINGKIFFLVLDKRWQFYLERYKLLWKFGEIPVSYWNVNYFRNHFFCTPKVVWKKSISTLESNLLNLRIKTIWYFSHQLGYTAHSRMYWKQSSAQSPRPRIYWKKEEEKRINTQAQEMYVKMYVTMNIQFDRMWFDDDHLHSNLFFPEYQTQNGQDSTMEYYVFPSTGQS